MQNLRITSIESRQHRERSVFFFSGFVVRLHLREEKIGERKRDQKSGCLSEGIQKGDNWVYTYI